MKYQVLYNTYTNNSMMEAFKNNQNFFVVESRNKREAEITAHHILFQRYNITPWKIINIMKLSSH